MSIILLRHLNNKRFGLAAKFITFNIRYFFLLWSYFNFHIGGHDLEIPRNLVRRFIIGSIHHKLQSYVGIIGTKLYKFWKFVRGKYKQIFFLNLPKFKINLCWRPPEIHLAGGTWKYWPLLCVAGEHLPISTLVCMVLGDMDIVSAWQM